MDLHQDPIGKEEVHMTRSASFAAAIFLLLLLGIGSTAWAYRDYFSETQKAQLTNIQTVLVEVIALTDTGAGNPEGIREVVTRRMKEMGYAAIADPALPHDVVVRVKCEQRKTWEGTAAAGGDNDLLDAPSRLWKGPACQVTYALGGMKIKWQKGGSDGI
jgi:hypothetical protein